MVLTSYILSEKINGKTKVPQVKKCDLFSNRTIWWQVQFLIQNYAIVLDKQGLQILVLIESRAYRAIFPGHLGSQGTGRAAGGMASGPPGAHHGVTCHFAHIKHTIKYIQKVTPGQMNKNQQTKKVS